MSGNREFGGAELNVVFGVWGRPGNEVSRNYIISRKPCSANMNPFKYPDTPESGVSNELSRPSPLVERPSTQLQGSEFRDRMKGIRL